VKNKIFQEIKTNKLYLLMSIIISILTMFPNIILASSEIRMYLLSIVLLILISKVSKIVFIILAFYINLMNILIIHIAIHWGYQYPDITSRLYVMALSPKYEMFEYINKYLDYRDMLIAVYVGLIFYLLILYSKRFNHTFKVIKIISLLFVFIVISSVGYSGRFNREPFNIVPKIVTLFDVQDYVEKRRLYLKTLDNNMSSLQNMPYDKVIVVVGESVNKHHMGIYNDDKNTTPFFSTMLKDNNLFVFNAIAPANLTRYAVPILLTKAHVTNFKDAFIHSSSIVTDFHSFGYSTKWISNQGRVGRTDSVITEISNEAETQTFFNQSDYLSAKSDQIILDNLKNQHKNNFKEMVVIHLMGSHTDYAKRYTHEHTLYENPKNIGQQYDNTIYFTDYILKNIYKYYNRKNQKILLVYFSDHGEVVSEEKSGHGYNPAYKDEYEVPFVIISNIKNKRILNLSTKNKKHYFNMENANYMIEYITGITDDLNISYSSKSFTLDPKYILDYKNLKRYGE